MILNEAFFKAIVTRINNLRSEYLNLNSEKLQNYNWLKSRKNNYEEAKIDKSSSTNIDKKKSTSNAKISPEYEMVNKMKNEIKFNGRKALRKENE